MNIPFGRHRGKPLCEVPRSYMRWLTSQIWFDLEYPELAAELRDVLNPDATPRDAARGITTNELKKWRSAVLLKWHPDRPGGSHAAFIAVTDAVDSLAALLADRKAARI